MQGSVILQTTGMRDNIITPPSPPARPARPNLSVAVADAVPQSAAAEKRTKAGKGEDFSKMTEEDLREVSTRWRDLADPKSGEEDKKFQVLVGAILSSRAQAAPVSVFFRNKDPGYVRGTTPCSLQNTCYVKGAPFFSGAPRLRTFFSFSF